MEYEAMSYIDQLPITSIEKEKLKRLAAPTPLALLGMIRASTAVFREFFGSEKTDRLVEWLSVATKSEELKRPLQPAKMYPIQELLFTPNPLTLPIAKYDLQERDLLFDRLQKLRSIENPTDQTMAEIATCEARLNAMLELV
jgi:hypothetical protein